ncbi:hypothetical protein P154DRAFT_597981 [Amniculicola lignicola CBS 123094]|uniref:Uncharacterized protein n=1 Tax=Amniculicola lignicola CBS 123094 TaxID=1392246 RepID=A0A6A5WHD6_9PLEO|nr:hypothetical protein P154DRAFT_597981 [Amniculicola lignicola CBS 123094]
MPTNIDPPADPSAPSGPYWRESTNKGIWYDTRIFKEHEGGIIRMINEEYEGEFRWVPSARSKRRRAQAQDYAAREAQAKCGDGEEPEKEEGNSSRGNGDTNEGNEAGEVNNGNEENEANSENPTKEGASGNRDRTASTAGPDAKVQVVARRHGSFFESLQISSNGEHFQVFRSNVGETGQLKKIQIRPKSRIQVYPWNRGYTVRLINCQQWIKLQRNGSKRRADVMYHVPFSNDNVRFPKWAEEITEDKDAYPGRFDRVAEAQANTENWDEFIRCLRELVPSPQLDEIEQKQDPGVKSQIWKKKGNNFHELT